jgi:hypothetical protein
MNVSFSNVEITEISCVPRIPRLKYIININAKVRYKAHDENCTVPSRRRVLGGIEFLSWRYQAAQIDGTRSWEKMHLSFLLFLLELNGR